jgi:uncharacterized protein (UPF0332 family)
VRDVEPDEWIESAYRRLDDARFLFSDDRTETALSQAYFAIFYACQALLVARGLRYKTHSSVVGTVGRFVEYRERLDTRLPAQLQTERERCDDELERYSDTYVEKRLREVSQFIEQAEVVLR